MRNGLPISFRKEWSFEDHWEKIQQCCQNSFKVVKTFVNYFCWVRERLPWVTRNQGWLKKNTTVAGFTKRFYTGVFMQSKSFFFLDSAHASKTVSPVTIDLGPKSEPTWVSVWAVLQDVCILRFLCLPDSYGTYWDHARRSFCSPVLHTCYPWAPHLKGPMSPESYVPQL